MESFIILVLLFMENVRKTTEENSKMIGKNEIYALF